MRYAEWKCEGFMIGSGAVEAAHKMLVVHISSSSVVCGGETEGPRRSLT